MAITKTQIISLAVMELGHAAVQSLIDGDDMVVAAEQFFDMKLPAVLAAGNWRFATQIQTLSQSAITPPYPWQYAYLLPAGFLKMLRIFPNIYDWDIYTNQFIYTTFNGTIQMEYTFQPDVSMLPNYFADYFVYEISAALALSTAQNTQFYSALEAKRIQMQALANAIDSQNRPNFSQTSIPMLNQRYIGGYIGNSFNV